MRVSDSSYVQFLLEQLPMDWSMIREKLVGAIHGSENDKEIELEKERLRQQQVQTKEMRAKREQLENKIRNMREQKQEL